MKVLFSRITKAINTKPKIEDLCEDLTLIGIEVDEIKSLKGDKIIDFDLTPNRGDCFSLKAWQETIVRTKIKNFFSNKTSFKGETKFNKKIKLLTKDACPAYSAVSITNLKLIKKFPII